MCVNLQLKHFIFVSILLFCFLILIIYSNSMDRTPKELFARYSFKRMPNFKISRNISSSSVLLPNGNVLFSGGYIGTHGTTETTEIYNPHKNKFYKSVNMSQTRANHSSILLKNGDVLLTGGFAITELKTGGFARTELKSAEIYNVKENKFVKISDMNEKMSGHKMYLLQNNNVVVIENPNKIELFDVKTNTFKKIKGIPVDSKHTSYNSLQLSENKILMYPIKYIPQKTPVVILNLSDFSLTYLKIILFEGETSYYNITKISENEIFVTGGEYRGLNRNKLSSKIIDLAKMEFSQTPNLSEERYKHVSIKLDNNNILLLGGESGIAYTLESLKTTDLYNIEENKFLKFKKLKYKRCPLDFIKLSNGNYLIWGGYNVFGKIYPPEMLVVKNK